MAGKKCPPFRPVRHSGCITISSPSSSRETLSIITDHAEWTLCCILDILSLRLPLLRTLWLWPSRHHNSLSLLLFHGRAVVIGWVISCFHSKAHYFRWSSESTCSLLAGLLLNKRPIKVNETLRSVDGATNCRREATHIISGMPVLFSGWSLW